MNALRYFLFLLLLPVLAAAQTNEDYMRLVRRVDTPRTVFTLPHSSVNRAVRQVIGELQYPRSIRNISVSGNQYILHDYIRTLSFTGTYSTSAALSQANRQPALQHEYAQGINNQYQGPETGTLFSYGPAISTLEFDGSSYAYDQNGRLVQKGAGNGQAGKAYDNGILRTGMMLSNDFLLKTTYRNLAGNRWSLELKAGKQNDRSIIRQNDNERQKWEVNLLHDARDLKLNFKYADVADHFNYSNRNGFLNRVYQYSLLTPVSFQNSQGTMLGSAQRSYSYGADNPLFLLQDHDNGYRRHSRNASMVIENKAGRFSYSLIPDFQNESTNSIEAFAQGTTGFPGGMLTRREQNDYRFLTKGNAKYTFPIELDYTLRSSVELNYNYSNLHTDIRYRDLVPDYRYRRTIHEPNLTYSAGYDLPSRWTFLVDVSNKLYLSSTTDRSDYWLPAATIVLVKWQYIRGRQLWIRFRSHLNHFDSELPIQQSQSAINLVKYSTATLPSFLPITEVNQYQQLHPIQHREWDHELSASYGLFNASFTYFQRQTSHDAVPIISGNTIQLQNVASHVNKGWEILLSHFDVRTFNRRGKFNSRLSFSTNRHIITAVEKGYNYTPTAGLSEVHTALVEGAPSNVIVGSAYLRDANHQIVTDADGHPVADPQLKVIGNPNPDFWLSLSNYLSYGSVALNVSWQWKKGGEKWNGTAAMLDYYGRSAGSALQRKETSSPLTPIAEKYIQRSDYLRINNISLTLERHFKGYVNKFRLTGFLRNILIWTPYKGADPAQTLLDQGYSTALDLYNLPATSTAGIEATISF